MLYAFIPARYQSTRLPGKPLIDILGKTLLQRVYEGVKQSKLVDKIIILTDDIRIFNSSKDFLKNNDNIVMTPKNLNSGTERIAYFLEHNQKEASKIDFILNIQGDEPLIDKTVVNTIATLTKKCNDIAPMSTLYKKSADVELFCDPNTVKLVKDINNNAIYFSRATIPYFKNKTNKVDFFKHIGVYGYKKDFLKKYVNFKNKTLENIESLEQLRVLENGYKILTAEISKDLIGVDTKDDLERVKQILSHK